MMNYLLIVVELVVVAVVVVVFSSRYMLNTLFPKILRSEVPSDIVSLLYTTDWFSYKNDP